MRPIKITQSFTSRDSASLEKYLQDISKIPMITPDEEIILTKKIRGGNKQALAVLAQSNLRFVVSVAKQYQHRGLSLPDLISEGNIGLFKAAQNFDETKGFKFISYAVWWIRQSIIHAINTKSLLIRLPENRVNQRNRIQQHISQLEQELERSPSVDEISQQVHLTVKEVEQITCSAIQHESLDVPLSSDNMERTLLDVLSCKAGAKDEDFANTKSLQYEIKRCLSALTPIQEKIVCWFFGIGRQEEMHIDDIGRKLNLSAERVRQIKQKAILQLRKEDKAALLKPFMG